MNQRKDRTFACAYAWCVCLGRFEGGGPAPAPPSALPGRSRRPLRKGLLVMKRAARDEKLRAAAAAAAAVVVAAVVSAAAVAAVAAPTAFATDGCSPGPSLAMRLAASAKGCRQGCRQGWRHWRSTTLSCSCARVRGAGCRHCSAARGPRERSIALPPPRSKSIPSAPANHVRA